MKPNPMSSKFAAAAILLVTAGATLNITPALAAEPVPTPIVQTIEQYDLASFKTSTFKNPQTVSWAVAYATQTPKNVKLDPAEKALLQTDAELAKKQKTNVEKKASVERAEQKRIAAEKAAAEKAEADRIAAENLAAEKAAAEAARVAAEKAHADRLASQRVASAPTTYAQGYAQGKAAQSASPSYASNAATTPSAPTATSAVPSSAIGAALVASAYSQLGIKQDCTAMVEKALRSVGKSVGDLGPQDFYRYGTVVSTPQPGDLMIRPGHVAIYVGNGMAISGGFNNFNTELHPASYLAGSTFVRVS